MKKPPIKVLYAIGTLDRGGAERQLVELTTGLDRTRFSPVVCVLAGDGPLGAVLRQHAVPVHCLGFRGFRSHGTPIHLASTVRALHRLWRIMRHERPVVFHGLLFWAYIIGSVVARAARVPIVVTSRRSLGHFKAEKPLFLFIERFVNRLTDLLIANSEAVRQDVIRQERVDPGKIIVIYNGLDPDRFTHLRDGSVKSELGLGASPVVTVVCNFIAYKGHRYFFEAWREVVKEHPDAVALLIGEGPTRRGWEQWCLDAGIDATVRFLGSRGDVPRILSSADLFVHPSLEEGYSNAVLEAMASSLPVIVTAVGGNVEAVQHEVTGLLVPARDPAALASAMIRLLGDAAARERLGSAARFRVEQEFHIARMIEAYQRVYDRLIESLHSGTEKQHVWDSRPV